MAPAGRKAGVLAVAKGDLFWIALLLPMAAAFQCVIALARGYYYFRRRSLVAAGAYVVATFVLAAMALRQVRR